VYEPVRFKTFSSRGEVDVLAAGGSVQLGLREDKTASLTMHLPEGALPGAATQEVSAEGTWAIENHDWVHLELASDPPLVGARYLVRRGQLLGTETTNSGTAGFTSFEIALARKPSS
jgi:hypothetical protein